MAFCSWLGGGGGGASKPRKRASRRARCPVPGRGLWAFLLLSALLACAPALLAHAAPPADLGDRITVLNQQSHPEVGRTWTVEFEAGGGELRVSGYGGTVLGDGPGADVSFEYLIGPGGARVHGSAGKDYVAFDGYGPGTGHLAVTVKTPGAHSLRLQSGSAVSYAHNWAYPESASKIQTGTSAGPSVSAGADFGKSVAGIGDLDRDGVPDIVAGAPGNPSRGQIHVMFMNSDGTAKRTAGIHDGTASGPTLSSGDNFGSSVAGVGDIDGDGVQDVAAGAPGDDAGGAGRGALHVMFLNSDGTVKRTAEINSATANGPVLSNGDNFGSSVAGIGDLDRDGVPDIAAGAPGDEGIVVSVLDNSVSTLVDSGALHVMFMNSDGTVKRTAKMDSSPDGLSLSGGDLFGSSVAGVGDIDGDGIPDIAVGAEGDDAGGADRGALHVVFLDSDGTAKRTAEIDSSTPGGPRLADGDSFGASAAALGDLDADGVPDVAAGAPGDDAGGAGRGALHVVFLNPDGTAKRTAEINSTTANGPRLADGDGLGSSAAGIGDIDGDGTQDMAAGAPNAGSAGDVHVIRLDAIAGRGNGLAEAVEKAANSTSTLLSPSSGDQFGRAAANVGDLNGDGFAELAVGAPYDGGGGADRGAVSVLFMKLDGTVRKLAKIDSTTANGPSLADNDEFGFSAAGVGDLDRDGVPDMAVGARGDDAGGPDRGAVHVLFLNSDGTVKGTAEINSTTTNGPSLADDDAFGSSVAGIGDLDGDGVGDIAVGAPEDDDGHRNRGAVHVLFMNSDGTVKRTAEINSTTPNGPSLANNDNFGFSAAGLGDLDGDGVPDVAAGAWGDDAGGGQRGAVHVLFMNSDGTVKRTAEINSATPNGPSLANGDFFGYSAAALGDLDGDGNADMAAGAVGDDEGGSSRGALHVLFLNSDGTVKGTAEINSTTQNGPSLEDASFFGSSAAALGDLDGDGIPDIAAGAERDDAGSSNFDDDTGAVYVAFMKADGAPKKTAMLEYVRRNGPLLDADDNFGAGAAGIGDLDRDGVPDLAAGAPGDDGADDGRRRDRGAVHVMFMDPDGTVASMARIGAGTADGPQLADFDNFGSSVAGIGDLDRDGVPDLAAGAWGDDAGGFNTGAVHVMFLNPDGTVKRTAEINGSTPNGPSLGRVDQFGHSVAGIGDLDRDGVPDIAVGAPGDDAGGNGRGALHVLFLNSDGTVKRTAEINSATANGPSLADGVLFGSSAAGVGDIDGDGIQDVAAGAERDDGNSVSVSANSGAVYIMFMNSDGTVKGTAKIDNSTANGPGIADGDLLGAVSAAGDMDGDGTPDIAAGAPGGNEAHVMLLNSDGSVKRTVAMNSASLPGTTLSAGESFGRSVGFAGDLNRDGAADLVVGADDSESRGAAYVALMSKNAVVVNATSTAADGAYVSGSTMDLLVEFSERVEVTGTPKLELETGAADAVAPYVSGSGTDTLAFRYAVADGHASDDLDYVGASSLSLDGGTVRKAGGQGTDAALALPVPGRAGSISSNKDIVVDTTRPLLSRASIDLGTGTLSVVFDEEIGARVDVSSVTLRDAHGLNPTALGGARVSVDGRTAAISVEEAQRTDIIRDRHRIALIVDDPPILMDVSGSAVRDVAGNFFAGVTSHPLDVVPDSIPPALDGLPVADFVAGTLRVGFTEEIDVVSMNVSGLALLLPDRSERVALGGATAAYSDGAVTVTFADAHNRRLYETGIASSGSALLDIVALSVPDISSNYFPGVRSSQVAGHYYAAVQDSPQLSGSVGSHLSATESSDAARVSDSARSLKSGSAPSDTAAFSDSARSLKSALSPSDAARVSDSARSLKSGSAPSDTAAFSDSARSLKSALSPSDAARVSDSARSLKSGSAPSDSAAVSDSVRARLSAAALSGAPSVSDSASVLRHSAASSQDAARVSDSARAFKSGFSASDAAVLLDSATAAGMKVGLHSDTAAFSDSARAFKSGFSASDAAVLLDSATAAGMKVGLHSDTAAFSDSARAFKSGFSASDAAVLSDSAATAGMRILVSADTAVFSDSARSYKSVFLSSDTAAFSDSASGANMVLSSLSDTAAFSDSARSYKSVFLSSDTAAFSDSASGANMVLSSLSDTAAFSDTASVASMRLAGLSDAATVSDSARAYKSGFAQSSSPDSSDSAGRAGMRVAVSADTGVFSDSAASFKSSASARDSLSPSDSASYAGLFVQGRSDDALLSDSARAYKSGSAQSSSPALSDSASGLAALSRPLSSSPAPSDSARAYKSSFPASSLAAPFDSARWGSARNASDSSSPTIADSALARVSSVAESDSPVLADSARAGASAALLSDSPVLRDGAATGAHPTVNARDLPSVSDSAAHLARAPAPEERGTAGPARTSGGGGGAVRGAGSVGVDLTTIHAVLYERCSDEPRVTVIASPPEAAVTVEQEGTRIAAQPSGLTADAPDSSVWTAPLLPDAQRLHVHAVPYRGGPATGDSQIVDTESCSGSVRFTAFGALPDVRAPEPAAPPAVRAGPPEPEDAGATTDAPGPRADTAPAAAPKTGSPPTAAPAGARESAAPAQDGPADLGAEPPAPKTETARDAPDLLREPREPAQAAPAFELWHAAAAAALAAAALAAARLARKI